jgi:protein-S-isoprenylcysteine O-methyltransferase Ste14
MTALAKNRQPAARQLISPVLAVICLATMFLLSWFCPLLPILLPPFNLAGLLIGGFGLAFCYTAKQQFKKAGTTLYPFSEPGKLVTDGLFRYTRNPMYLGLSILLTGAWLLLGSLSPVGIVVAFVLIIDHCYIVHEEQNMTAAFGKAYKAYQAKTPRWI